MTHDIQVGDEIPLPGLESVTGPLTQVTKDKT